ncbi:hypothetical protein NDU88_001375 [Pleurodeles waltl]|uniref:Uncharacterized protein n=1 Tax=Pleurodeles waltl TaxID=8319 RepID=A0AAV7RA51_PLEWA|nr:hypothetical protein NDU88_001375 [Pleurodeles waltl]
MPPVTAPGSSGAPAAHRRCCEVPLRSSPAHTSLLRPPAGCSLGRAAPLFPAVPGPLNAYLGHLDSLGSGCSGCYQPAWPLDTEPPRPLAPKLRHSKLQLSGLPRALKSRPTPTRLGPLRHRLLALGLPGC